MADYMLSLYVTADHAHTEVLLEELRSALDGSLRDEYLLEVIDVANEPDRARDANVYATPTLVRTSPIPVKRLIGDLRDTGSVLTALGL